MWKMVNKNFKINLKRLILWPVAYQKLIFWGLFCCCDDPSKFCCCVFMNSIVQNRNFEDSEIVQWWNNLDCLRCLAPRTWDLSHYMLQDREWHGPVHCNCGTVTYILFQTMLLQHIDIIIVAGGSSADVLTLIYIFHEIDFGLFK